MVPAKFIEAKPKQDQNQKKSLSSASGKSETWRDKLQKDT